MPTRFTRLAGLLGLLMPIVTLTAVFISIGLSPWFNWHTNDLSDLGVSQTSNPFNAALVIGGLLYLVFVIGFLRWQGSTSPLAKIGAFFLLIGGLGLALIGVFPEDVKYVHYIVAVTYFVATPLAYGLFGTDLLKRGEPVSGVLTLAASIATLCLIALVPHKRIAVPEILASVVIAAWTFSIGVRMLIEPEHNHGKTQQAIQR